MTARKRVLSVPTATVSDPWTQIDWGSEAPRRARQKGVPSQLASRGTCYRMAT
jgi:hypothetical protein